MLENNMQAEGLSTEEKVAYIYKYLLILFLHEQKTEAEVLEYLMSEGMGKEDAGVMIVNTKVIIYKSRKPKAIRNFFLGVLLALFGLAGIVSFFGRPPESVTVFITMVVLVYGCIKFTESITALKEIARFENRKAMFKWPTLKEFFYNLRTLEKRYRVSNDDEPVT
jgi:hypothetical protein